MLSSNKRAQKQQLFASTRDRRGCERFPGLSEVANKKAHPFLNQKQARSSIFVEEQGA